MRQRVSAIYDNVLLQFTIGTLLQNATRADYNFQQVLQITTTVITIRNRYLQRYYRS